MHTSLTFFNLGNPTGLKFAVEHGSSRVMFEAGVEHAPGAIPFSLGLQPRPGRELEDLVAVGMAPRGTGVLGEWDGRTHLFLSHMHLDHVALAHFVHPSVPMFYPEAMDPVREACARSGYQPWREPPGTPVADREGVKVGDIEVEFVAVDHDVPGATGFIVRAPDLTLAYTGDNRWHGLHPELMERFVAAVRGVPVLLQEAVSVGWEQPPPPPVEPASSPGTAPLYERTEADLVTGLADLLGSARGLVVVNLYPMNRERVHALGLACLAHGRTFLMERQAAIMAGWPHVLEDIAAARQQPDRYCLQLGFEQLPLLIDLRPPAGSLYVHSNGTPLGPFDPAYNVMRTWVSAFAMEFAVLASTGHSRPADVRRMVAEIAPGVVLPVHSRRPEALQVPGVPTLVPLVGRSYTIADFEGTALTA